MYALVFEYLQEVKCIISSCVMNQSGVSNCSPLKKCLMTIEHD